MFIFSQILPPFNSHEWSAVPAVGVFPDILIMHENISLEI